MLPLCAARRRRRLAECCAIGLAFAAAAPPAAAQTLFLAVESAPRWQSLSLRCGETWEFSDTLSAYDGLRRLRIGLAKAAPPQGPDATLATALWEGRPFEHDRFEGPRCEGTAAFADAWYWAAGDASGLALMLQPISMQHQEEARSQGLWCVLGPCLVPSPVPFAPVALASPRAPRIVGVWVCHMPGQTGRETLSLSPSGVATVFGYDPGQSMEWDCRGSWSDLGNSGFRAEMECSAAVKGKERPRHPKVYSAIAADDIQIGPWRCLREPDPDGRD